MLQTLRIYWLQRTRSNELGPSYKQFYGSDWPGVEFLHQFGEMGVVKTARKIQNKLENKGTTLIYCGRAANHGADVHRFFNERTKRIIMSRDVQWLKKVYGDWKGIEGKKEKKKKKSQARYVEVDIPSVSAVVSRANEPIVVDSDLSDVGEGNDEGNLQDESESEADEAPDASDKSERKSDEPDDDADEEEEAGVQGTPTTPRTLPIRSGRQLNSPARVRGMQIGRASCRERV